MGQPLNNEDLKLIKESFSNPNSKIILKIYIVCILLVFLYFCIFN